MSTLAVAEIFGPTFQGEGPSTGRLAHFLRLGGCNLACSWCDTPYTWDGRRYDLRAEITNMSGGDVRRRLGEHGLVVITGGEPLLQAIPLTDLVLEMWQRGVEVETNGTLPPPTWVHLAAFNVSPKLPNAGRTSTLHHDWHRRDNVRFKFVVREPADLELVAAYGTPPERTWIMPEGVEGGWMLARAQQIADEVAQRGWNLTLRQHVLLWGGARGR